MENKGRGNVIIVAAPSGGGKTSLVKALVDTLPDIEVSISHTTRAKKPGEEDSKDYFFVNPEQFQHMIDEGAFVEYAKVFNHFYGTSIDQMNDRLQQGIDVVLDIDWQGARQIRRLYPDALSVFIVPPSLAILKKRLLDRRRDDNKVIAERMLQAQDEMSHFSEFDYLIVNDDFQVAAEELQAIVRTNRVTLKRQMERVGNLLSLLLASQ